MQKRYNNHGLIRDGNTINSNDYISGTYKDIKFEQSDIEVKDIQNTSDGKEILYIFNGRFFIFEFEKNFKYFLQIKESRAIISANQRIQVEDIEFNKKFLVKANSQQEAFYMLTPIFIENIKQIEKISKGRIMFSFIDNKLYIALDGHKGAFEPSVLKGVDEERMYENIIDDIKVITNFVNELKLSSNLFA